ncbi:acyl-CoA dehydrogenase family protein [Microbacterium rhizomatis]|uniref:Acyl-CoA dehydrogenase n=1 Tax=Microbacterium rhizomatis TaxID=1631477 RepID=A0A5J5IWP2_9MICO|nr:acyl-CoA dehydrogenase family protein [Microbacterium rhizomatis]KAA9105891.1 acyl-CoA dehydrogenase [Microbacterium rhizomatis]
MNITESAEVTELRGVLRRLLLRDAAADSPVIRRSPRVWDTLTQEIGLLEVFADPGALDAIGEAMLASVLCEEIGRALAPAPLAGTIVALGVLRRCQPATDDIVSSIVSDHRTAGVALADRAINLEPGIKASTGAEGWHASGEAALAMTADQADVLVVPAASEAGVVLLAIDTSHPSVRVIARPTLDGTRAFADLVLETTPARLIADAGAASTMVDFAYDRTALLLAAEALGGARHCLEITLTHVKQRSQFGRPIGSFQAVKHRLADHAVAIEATASLVALAAAIADDPDADPAQISVAASVAKAHSSETFTAVAGDSIQLHGGIGFTWEHQAHRYFKRAHVTARYWGSAASHRARIASIMGW